MNLEVYATLLASLHSHGYMFVTFDDAVTADSSHKYVLLRHDVDFSLDLAAEMASWEAARGIHADYFVQVRSPLYNAMSADSRRAMAEILEGGHRIGLHFDASLYSDVTFKDVQQELR